MCRIPSLIFITQASSACCDLHTQNRPYEVLHQTLSELASTAGDVLDAVEDVSASSACPDLLFARAQPSLLSLLDTAPPTRSSKRSVYTDKLR